MIIIYFIKQRYVLAKALDTAVRKVTFFLSYLRHCRSEMLLLSILGLVNKAFYKMKAQFGVQTSLAYGFESGGQANISITNSDTAMVFGIMTMEEYEAMPGGPLKMSSYCGYDPEKRITTYQAFVDSPPGNNTLSVIIDKKAVYVPFYMLCYDVAGVYFAQWEGEISFKNKNGWLDYRWGPAKIYEPILIVIQVCILVAWLINWFMHLTLKIKIHFLITAAFATGSISQCIVYLSLLISDAEGATPGGLSVMGYLISLLYNAALFGFLLLAVNGWYIVKQKLDMKKMTAGWAYMICYLISLLISGISSSLFGLFMSFVGIMCLFGYLWTLLRDIKETIRSVLAHLVVIRENGIDPKTTPIYRKHQLMQLLNKVIIGYICLKVVYLMFMLYSGEITYYSYLIDGLIDSLLWCFMAWIFHLRKDYAVNYLVIDETADENGVTPTYSPAEYQLEDLENMTLESPELEGGHEYVYGTPLPPQPMVMNSVTPPPLDPRPSPAEEAPVTVMPAPPQNPYDDEY